jgi:hypothetical protein
VPAYSHNKMRVCGYHILANLPDKLRHLVNSGGSISSDPEGARLLANVLRGNHVSIIQHVEVGGHGGTNVTYTDVRASVASNEALLPVATAMTLGTASTLDMEEPLEAKLPVAPDVKAAELVAKPDENITKPVIKNLMSNSTEKKADKAESEPKPAEVTPFRSLNQKDKAARLYVAMRDAPNTVQLQEAARALQEFKKQARKSWTALGLPEDAGQESGTILDKADKPAQPKAEAKAKKQVTVTQVSTKDAGKDTIVVHVTEAVTLLKDGKLSNIEIARKTGLSKDQIYRLKKKHCG